MLGRVARLVGYTNMKLPVCKFNQIVEDDKNTHELLEKLKNEFGEDYSNYYTIHCDNLYKLIDYWINYKRLITTKLLTSWGDREKESASLYYLALCADYFINHPDANIPENIDTFIQFLNRVQITRKIINKISFSETV